MKTVIKSLTMSVLVLTSSLAIAGSRSELQPTMKQMGQQMKVLVMALVKKQDTPKESLLAAAHTLASLVEEAAKAAPKQYLDVQGNPLPGAEAELAKYDALIANLLVESRNLEAALAQGDQAAAADVLQSKIIPIQREGHDLFKSVD